MFSFLFLFPCSAGRIPIRCLSIYYSSWHMSSAFIVIRKSAEPPAPSPRRISPRASHRIPETRCGALWRVRRANTSKHTRGLFRAFVRTLMYAGGAFRRVAFPQDALSRVVYVVLLHFSPFCEVPPYPASAVVPGWSSYFAGPEFSRLVGDVRFVEEIRLARVWLDQLRHGFLVLLRLVLRLLGLERPC